MIVEQHCQGASEFLWIDVVMIDLLRRLVVNENGVHTESQHPIQSRFDLVICDIHVGSIDELVDDSLVRASRELRKIMPGVVPKSNRSRRHGARSGKMSRHPF